MDQVFTQSGPLAGTVRVPGDKSISHRAAMIGALGRGTTNISNFSSGADCASTLSVLRGLGVRIEAEGGRLAVEGIGGKGFAPERVELDCGNSGTTMRLACGMLAPFPVELVLSGDSSLRKRPMRRVIEPLELMGARITPGDEQGHPPLALKGTGPLAAISYAPEVASAQVKSAVLLAGLGADGPTCVTEVAPTRDHTERMLRRAGVEVRTRGLEVTVEPAIPSPFDIFVPGDFSSAAFFIAAALMRPGSRVTVAGAGLNASRTGFLDVLEAMGARVSVSAQDVGEADEPAGDIVVEHGPLKAAVLGGRDVVTAIDEVTLVALLATSAEGRTVIAGAGELRKKESDRISGTVAGLKAMGASIEETADGMVIEGPVELRGADVFSSSDHRIGMMLAVAGISASGSTKISGWEWTAISYPGFAEELAGLAGGDGR
jgi:3-phosphoshikimate 1-carboxyvinyltransferase